MNSSANWRELHTQFYTSLCCQSQRAAFAGKRQETYIEIPMMGLWEPSFQSPPQEQLLERPLLLFEGYKTKIIYDFFKLPNTSGLQGAGPDPSVGGHAMQGQEEASDTLGSEAFFPRDRAISPLGEGSPRSWVQHSSPYLPGCGKNLCLSEATKPRFATGKHLALHCLARSHLCALWQGC